jgi:hypothetical protein
MSELHQSHRWGERMMYGESVPVCLDCRTDGFDDVPAAFDECPGPPEPKTKGRAPCSVTMWSLDDPGHQHVCLGGHTDGDHFCKDCRRWYNVRPGSSLAVPR